MQADIADKLWAAVEPVLFISKDQFFQNLHGWQVSPVWIDGEMAFVTLTNGPAFHFLSCNTGHQISLKMIRDFLQQIIDREGYATTKTPKDDARQHRFNLRFGFYVIGEDEHDIHYRIDRLKGAPCQS